jgi:hypothetical protein
LTDHQKYPVDRQMVDRQMKVSPRGNAVTSGGPRREFVTGHGRILSHFGQPRTVSNARASTADDNAVFRRNAEQNHAETGQQNTM